MLLFDLGLPDEPSDRACCPPGGPRGPEHARALHLGSTGTSGISMPSNTLAAFSGHALAQRRHVSASVGSCSTGGWRRSVSPAPSAPRRRRQRLLADRYQPRYASIELGAIGIQQIEATTVSKNAWNRRSESGSMSSGLRRIDGRKARYAFASYRARAALHKQARKHAGDHRERELKASTSAAARLSPLSSSANRTLGRRHFTAWRQPQKSAPCFRLSSSTPRRRPIPGINRAGRPQASNGTKRGILRTGGCAG